MKNQSGQIKVVVHSHLQAHSGQKNSLATKKFNVLSAFNTRRQLWCLCFNEHTRSWPFGFSCLLLPVQSSFHHKDSPAEGAELKSWVLRRMRSAPRKPLLNPGVCTWSQSLSSLLTQCWIWSPGLVALLLLLIISLVSSLLILRWSFDIFTTAVSHSCPHSEFDSLSFSPPNSLKIIES